jgi:hypothetical protein
MFDTAEMLKIFQRYRGDAIVIPGRGGRHWNKISTRPNLDLPLGDPAMGGHASFALGLALARPERKVVLFDSEGDLLMGRLRCDRARRGLCARFRVQQSGRICDPDRGHPARSRSGVRRDEGRA